MTTGPDNLGNGAAKTEDRFAGQLGYRPRTTRDSGSLPPASPLGGGPLGGGALGSGARAGANNSANVSSINGGSRGAGTTGTRANGPLGVGPLDRTEDFSTDDFGTGLERIASPLDVANPIASTLTQPKLDDAVLHEPSLPDLGFHTNGYREPQALPLDSWLDGPGHGVADHPLLRGLLLELPPKGSRLQGQWLERWFEAARSILELLYRFEDKRD
jgi:hypothetical protein